MELLTYTWAGAQLVLQRNDEKISLVGLFPSGANQTDQDAGGALSQTQCFEGLHSNSVAQVQQTGEDRPCHHGVRSIGAFPGDRLTLKSSLT